MHHCIKFCQNRSFLFGDIAIFRIFNMAVAVILDFWNREILLVTWVQSVETHQCAKFRQNRSICCEDIKIFRFFKIAAVRRLVFVWGIFGPPTVSIWGVSFTLQNLIMIDAVVFIIWTFQYLACLAGKWLFTPQKLFFFGQFDPLNGLQYQPKPKNVHACVSPHHFSH